MKRYFKTFALIFFVLVLCASAARAEPVIRKIKEPTFSQAAFVLPGGELKVRIIVPDKERVEKAELLSLADGKSAASMPLDTTLDAGENTLNLKTPAALPPALYDLCVYFGAGLKKYRECQRHSVAVVKSLDAPFTVVQITDYHVGDPRAEKQFPGVDMEKVRIAAFEAANREKPAFILVTGDITAYPDGYAADYPRAAKEIISHASAPLIIIPGNHDLYAKGDDKGNIVTDGKTFWPDYFGATHRVLDFGPFRFICVNTYDWPVEPRVTNKEYHSIKNTTHTYSGTLSKSEFGWVLEQLKTAGGRTPILVAHHDPRRFEAVPRQWCNACVTPAKFTAALTRYKVPYYIYGHIHRTTDTTDRAVRYISTTSVGSDVDKNDLWAVRVIRFKADGTIETQVKRLFDAPPMK